VFISHGTHDTVMPIDKTGRDVFRRLKALEYDVTYREFDGGHGTPSEIVREAFEWFIRS
jgi:phospholipase/carboxylesterase